MPYVRQFLWANPHGRLVWEGVGGAAVWSRVCWVCVEQMTGMTARREDVHTAPVCVCGPVCVCACVCRSHCVNSHARADSDAARRWRKSVA